MAARAALFFKGIPFAQSLILRDEIASISLEAQLAPCISYMISCLGESHSLDEFEHSIVFHLFYADSVCSGFNSSVYLGSRPVAMIYEDWKEDWKDLSII